MVVFYPSEGFRTQDLGLCFHVHRSYHRTIEVLRRLAPPRSHIKRESAAHASFRRDSYLATLQLSEFATDKETESRATVLDMCPGARLTEPLEQHDTLLLLETAARVFDFDVYVYSLASAPSGAEGHVFTGGTAGKVLDAVADGGAVEGGGEGDDDLAFCFRLREFDGVGGEVDEDLEEPAGV